MAAPVVLLPSSSEKAVARLGNQVECVDWKQAEQRSEEVEGILVFGHAHLDGPVMDRFPRLKIISNCGVGVDHINVTDAGERGVLVGNTPEVLSGATADMAFALILATARRIVEGDAFARGPEFTHFDGSLLHGTEVHGTTCGIIGMGRIGSEVARRANGFQMRVIYHNRNRATLNDPAIRAEYVSKDQLLSESDFVVIVVPLNDSTRNLLTYQDLEKMKSSAILVNIARGGVVNTNDLTRALQDGQIRAAGLDVTEPEPLPRDHPILKQKNLVIAPHLGSATTQTRQAMFDLAISNLLNGLNGQKIVSSVMKV